MVNNLSYQLYSSRNFGPLAKTLKMVSDLGYRRVEGYGSLYAELVDVDALTQALDQNSLSMASGHVSLEMVEAEPQRVIDVAARLGMTSIFVPHLAAPARPDTVEGWTAFGRLLNEAGKPLKDAGLRFGWHNHDFEFAPLADGTFPLDAILEGGPEIDLQLDVAWLQRGGQDPFEWLPKLNGRIVAAHVKDIAPEGQAMDEDGWADVGHGVMDWPGLIPALGELGCDLFVVEHDNPNDDARFARRSLAFLNH